MCYVELTNHFGKFLLQCIIIVAVLKNSNSGGSENISWKEIFLRHFGKRF